MSEPTVRLYLGKHTDDNAIGYHVFMDIDLNGEALKVWIENRVLTTLRQERKEAYGAIQVWAAPVEEE